MKNFKEKLEKLLKKEKIFLDDKNEIDYIKVKDSADKIDAKLIEILISNKEAKNKFFTKIKDVFVFNINDFKFFLEESKVDNSYTAYKNRIGLTDGKKFLKDTNDVVLDFPYKDCVLEGGQSTEEGADIYFEYEQEKTKTIKGEKVIEEAGYKEKQGKRKEIFFNSVLAHDEIDRLFDAKALTNWKRFTKDGEQEVKEIKRDKDGTIKENLIIKGNNLLALHSLKKQFAGKVKLIYIDPPYNTGNDGFKYNDNFNHSTWLNFMKNRLKMAMELLGDDGIICIHLDDNETHYLKLLMDEIFSRDLFINSISIKDSHASGLKTTHKDKTIIKTKSQILCYSKTQNIKLNPLYQTRNDWDTHFNIYVDIDSEKLEKYSLNDFIKENEIVSKDFKLDSRSLENKSFRDFCFKKRDYIFQSTKEIPEYAKNESLKNKNEVIEYQTQEGNRQFAFNGRRLSPLTKSIWNVGFDGYYKEDFGKLLCDFWDDIDFNNSQNEGGVSLSSGKKPEFLLARIISLFSNKSDIVLDFFGGSGTTGAVAHKINRQYILIEQMDYVHDLPEARLIKVIQGEQSGISKAVNWQGGGDFIYFELAKWNETAKEKILACESLEDLIKFFDEMCEKYFLNYNLKIKEFREKVIKEKEFKNLLLDEQKKMFMAMLDNNQMYIQESEMKDEKFGIKEEDINLTNEFYNNK